MVYKDPFFILSNGVGVGPSSFPRVVGLTCPTDRVLYVHGAGEIPSELRGLTALTQLGLNGNGISGRTSALTWVDDRGVGGRGR